MKILGISYKQKEKKGIVLECKFYDEENQDKIKVKIYKLISILLSCQTIFLKVENGGCHEGW